MSLLESGEMYLESILILSGRKESVRAVDICEYLGYSKPSVSRAMGILKKGAYIYSDKEGHINLTESGREIAEKIYERHKIISEFLISLGVPCDIAQEDACKIEHDISDVSFNAIKQRKKD